MPDQFYDTPLLTSTAFVDGIFKGAVTGGIAYVGALVALASDLVPLRKTVFRPVSRTATIECHGRG